MSAVVESSPLRDSNPAAGPHRWLKAIQILIVFLPVLLTFSYIRALSVEVPIQDDWDFFVPHFLHLAAGQLQWSDINAQQNESLVAFPLGAALVLAKVTGGRFLAVCYLSYFFLCCDLGILFLFFKMLNLPGRWSILWFLPVSLLFLGWRQSDSLLWSTHLANTMTLFFVLAALYCCTRVCRAPIFFLAAILFAWMASFSMAGGILVWICGAAAIVVSGTAEWRFEQTLRHMVWWGLMGAVCGGCFFLDSAPHPVPWPTGLKYVASNPATAVKYTLTYLGGPLGATSMQGSYLGVIFSLIALPVLILSIMRIRHNGIMPGLLIAGYVGLALVPLLMGRMGLGIGQAFSSRYVTMGALAPIGVYFCSLSLARTTKSCRYLAALMLLLLTGAIFNSYSSGLADGRKESIARTGCAAAIKDFRHVDPRRLTCTYPDPGVVLQRAPGLERYHLSLFGD